MHPSRQTLSLIALCALAAAPIAAQTGLFRGSVVDESRNPLAGVQITVTSEDLASFRKSLTTDKDGQFKLRFQANQAQYVFEFLFEKPGYQSFTQAYSPSLTQAMKEQFVMDLAESRIVESRGDLSSVITGSSNAAVEAFNAGITAQREGDLGTARSKLEEALAADHSLAPAHVALAQVLLDQGDHDAALARADGALALTPGVVEALRVRYQALRELGRQGEADEVAKLLEQAEGAVAAARLLYNEGGEAFTAGDKEGALAKFREAAQLDPTLTDAHHAVATLELAAGNHAASAEAAQRALALGSEDIRTLRVLYDAYDALGRTEELAEIAPRLAAVDPDFGGTKLLEQAADNWNAGQADRAVRLSRMALAIDPSLAKAHYFIGLDHLSKGANAEAKAALTRFIEMAPDDAEAGTAREMLSYIE